MAWSEQAMEAESSDPSKLPPSADSGPSPLLEAVFGRSMSSIAQPQAGSVFAIAEPPPRSTMEDSDSLQFSVATTIKGGDATSGTAPTTSAPASLSSVLEVSTSGSCKLEETKAPSLETTRANFTVKSLESTRNNWSSPDRKEPEAANASTDPIATFSNGAQPAEGRLIPVDMASSSTSSKSLSALESAVRQELPATDLGIHLVSASGAILRSNDDLHVMMASGNTGHVRAVPSEAAAERLADTHLKLQELRHQALKDRLTVLDERLNQMVATIARERTSREALQDRVDAIIGIREKSDGCLSSPDLMDKTIVPQLRRTGDVSDVQALPSMDALHQRFESLEAQVATLGQSLNSITVRQAVNEPVIKEHGEAIRAHNAKAEELSERLEAQGEKLSSAIYGALQRFGESEASVFASVVERLGVLAERLPAVLGDRSSNSSPAQVAQSIMDELAPLQPSGMPPDMAQRLPALPSVLAGPPTGVPPGNLTALANLSSPRSPLEGLRTSLSSQTLPPPLAGSASTEELLAFSRQPAQYSVGPIVRTAAGLQRSCEVPSASSPRRWHATPRREPPGIAAAPPVVITQQSHGGTRSSSLSSAPAQGVGAPRFAWNNILAMQVETPAGVSRPVAETVVRSSSVPRASTVQQGAQAPATPSAPPANASAARYINAGGLPQSQAGSVSLTNIAESNVRREASVPRAAQTSAPPPVVNAAVQLRRSSAPTVRAANTPTRMTHPSFAPRAIQAGNVGLLHPIARE